MTSLKQRILRYFQQRPYFINSGEIEKLCIEAGYKATNGRRRLQELREEGLLDVRYTRRVAEYKTKMV